MYTEYEFRLPWGYVDEIGQVHQVGRMRPATAGDEITAVQELDDGHPAYLPVLLLSKVVTQLGGLPAHVLGPQVFEQLYAADMAYLSELYLQLNGLPDGYGR